MLVSKFTLSILKPIIIQYEKGCSKWIRLIALWEKLFLNYLNTFIYQYNILYWYEFKAWKVTISSKFQVCFLIPKIISCVVVNNIWVVVNRSYKINIERL